MNKFNGYFMYTSTIKTKKYEKCVFFILNVYKNIRWKQAFSLVNDILIHEKIMNTVRKRNIPDS